MIGLSDAGLLALTKLRTRRIRLGITIVVSASVFSLLAAASIITSGVFKSLDSFNEEGFGNRYILGADLATASFDTFTEPSVVERANALQKAEIAKKKTEAARLGIAYSAAAEPPVTQVQDGPYGKKPTLDISQPLAKKALTEYLVSHPPPGRPEVAKLAKNYEAKAYHQSITQNRDDSQTFSLTILDEGKEKFSKTAEHQNFELAQRGIDGFTKQWQLMSGELLKPFLLPGASLTTDSTGALPVVAPFSAVEQLLNLPELSKTATPEEKLARLKQVREGAKGVAFTACYRNQTSSDQLQEIITTNDEIERNKTTKDYQKPSLIYALPSIPCNEPTITSDTRTSEEKTLATKETEFRRIFGEPAPQSAIVSFKIVGVSPDPPDFNAFSISTVLNIFLSSNLGLSSWSTPLEARQSQPLLATIFPENSVGYSSSVKHFVELPSAEKARAFLKNENCEPDFSQFSNPSSDPTKQKSPFDACHAEGKPFIFSPFGSSSLAIDEARKIFASIFKIATLIVAGLAAIIMIGTVGRVIADSRRETAVFRAIGAKRLDIAQIYFTYTFLIASLVAIVTLCIGFILASLVNARYSNSLTIESLIAYNAQDLSRQFSLLDANLTQLLFLVGLIIAAGLVSACLPLISNLRRNPITDMRDET